MYCFPRVRSGRRGCRRRADRTRRESSCLELFCTCPELTVQISECGTVLMLLQLVAKQMGLPNFAAELLQMEFSEALLTHETKLKDAGLCNQALFSVQGEEEARAKVAKEERAARVARGYDYL